MPAPSRAWRRDDPTICRSFGFCFQRGRCEAAPFSSKDAAGCGLLHSTLQNQRFGSFSAVWLQWILVLNSPVIWVSTDTSSIVVGRFSTEARECLCRPACVVFWRSVLSCVRNCRAVHSRSLQTGSSTTLLWLFSVVVRESSLRWVSIFLAHMHGLNCSYWIVGGCSAPFSCWLGIGFHGRPLESGRRNRIIRRMSGMRQHPYFVMRH